MQFDSYIEEFIDLAFREDIGDGDHTSLSIIPETTKGKARLLVKQEGVIAGSNIAEKIFKKLDPDIQLKYFIADGSIVKPGDVVFIAEGKVLALLQAERLVLNIMQRMSGIATQTHRYVSELKGLKTKIIDTRKTTPGMRLLDKLAVKTGGGENHRIGLFDMILIKDNHVDFAGGIENAVERVKKYLQEKNKSLKIEVEARNLSDVETILKMEGIHRIMLDNFSLQETRKAVKAIGDKCETESSGGITLENLRAYAECGVDYISVGALTHQIKSIDLSFKAIDY
jgi:nicotinate-nucleotide pyrophosphorylase (carboxylating)